ncbi:MAG: hypothetical protein ACTSU3_06980 [Candidatus Thorarchaeota archaeon]
MSRYLHRNRIALGILSFLIIGMGLSSSVSTHVAAQETLTMTFSRNFGTALGDSMSGLFTLHCTGPEEITNLTVYFNSVEVHFVTGNTIAWQFHTSDYTEGATNITLMGIDDLGGTYLANRQVTFFAEEATNLITYGVIILVAVVVIARLVPLLRKKQRPN